MRGVGGVGCGYVHKCEWLGMTDMARIRFSWGVGACLDPLLPPFPTQAPEPVQQGVEVEAVDVEGESINKHEVGPGVDKLLVVGDGRAEALVDLRWRKAGNEWMGMGEHIA